MKTSAQLKKQNAKAAVFASAFATFAALNGFLFWAKPFEGERFTYPYKTWTSWTVEKLRSDTERRNLAILGSSLTVTALSEADAKLAGHAIDLSDYRDAHFLDHELEKKLHAKFRSINLSSPGQMPSDAYLTLKSALALGHHPPIVVYAIAPRDFIDGTMDDPTQTEAFKILERVVDTEDAANELAPSGWSKVFQTIKQNCYLVANAIDIQMDTSQTVENLLRPIAALAPGRPNWTWKERFSFFPNYRPMEVMPGALMAEVVSPVWPANVLPGDLSSYRARYHNYNSSAFKKQLDFLKRVSQLCREERIELVLVNMPIQECNLALLSPVARAHYLSEITLFAKQNDISFYDLCKPSEYSTNDYRDSVHLNATGGQKFVQKLVQTMTADDRTQKNLLSAGKSFRDSAVAGRRDFSDSVK
ncbi:MAG: hypothetical protein IAF58_17485 [Leptolyngbya sp.]|nr:hypothetical protein [Candidatus Melainabacteria bacterium]